MGVRGVWLTNVDSRVFDSSSNIREAMQFLAEQGFNVVFPVVWNKGFTLYPSQVMKTNFGKEFTIFPAYQSRDPLAEVLAAAKPFGIKVIPWFEYGFAYTHSSWQTPQKYQWEAELKSRNWLAQDQQGKVLVKNGFSWLNALAEPVQDFMLQLILEVVRNYAVAGVQGDDRLPALPVAGGYNPELQREYQQQKGQLPPLNPYDQDWVQWRCDRLTDFLRRQRTEVKNYNPELIISLACHPWQFGKQEYLQDVPRWLELGLVDWLHPQLYRRNLREYKALLRETCRQLTPEQRSLFFPGVLIKVGSFQLSPRQVQELIAYNRRLGVEGEVLFFYEGLRY